MSLMRHVGALALSAVVSSGCQGSEPLDETAQVAQQVRLRTQPNSSLAFGGMIGKTPIRGIRLSGDRGYVMSVDSETAAPLTGISWNGERVLGLSAPAGRLQATLASGTEDRFTASAPLVIRIGAPLAGYLRIYVQASMTSYTAYVTEFSADGRQWDAYCPHEYAGVAQGEIISFVAEPMIPVGGAKWDGSNGDRIEDSTALSLSCAHDAIGGCITWDYVPWQTVTYRGSTVSLVNHHQACTRLKRADFCGNGVPHTTLNEGVKKHTPIQVWDSVGLYGSDPQTRATMEGYWDVNGATCLNADRFRTQDTGSSQYLMLNDLRSCPKPRCTAVTVPQFLLGSGIPLQ